MSTQSGFSLIEMLVVIAIVGILAAIGVPAYGNYVTQGRVADATAVLAAKRNQMEQYYQDKLSYCSSAACTAAAAPCATDNSSSDFFDFGCDTNFTKESYTITATGKGPMNGFSFTINQKNQRTTTVISPAPQSWRTAVQSCWIMKAGTSC